MPKYPEIKVTAHVRVFDKYTSECLGVLDMDTLTEEQRLVVANGLTKEMFNAVFGPKGYKAEFTQSREHILGVLFPDKHK